MKFYVASKYENAQAVREAITRLTNLGHVVTHDWTKSEAWDWNEPGATEKYAPICSIADVKGVMNANILIVLTHNYQMMIGAHVELGIGLAMGIPIYIVGKQPRNIFSFHPNITRVETFEEVIEILSEIK
jgi:hypothetical protein